jgi:hypothetical protein
VTIGWRWFPVHIRTLLAAFLVAALAAPPAAAASAPEDPPPDHVLCVPDGMLPGETSASAAPQQAGLPFRLVVPGLALDARPAPLSPGLLALQDRLQTIVEETWISGRFAVAVTDLQTMETVGVALDRPQYAGCVANLFAIIAALQDVDAGKYALESVDATIRQTIWASDATAAYQLYRAVGNGSAVEGVRRVGRLYESLGMHTSLIDHPPAYTGDSLGISVNNYLTAREVNGALAALHRGQVLSPVLTAYLLEAMTHVKPGLNYLTAALPSAALVSHKNGFFWDAEGYVDNDAAIVRFGPDRQYAYAISFYSEAVPVKYADIPLGQSLVFEAWEYFSTTYR